MSTVEVAKAFTELLKKQEHEAAGDRFNADDITSYEAMEGPMAVLHGKDAVKQKMVWWITNHETHGGTVEGPYVNGDHFALRLTMDVTEKVTGVRRNVEEIAIYTVANDKIVSERFCYMQA